MVRRRFVAPFSFEVTEFLIEIIHSLRRDAILNMKKITFLFFNKMLYV